MDVRNKKHWFNLSAGRRVMAAPGKQPNKAEKKNGSSSSRRRRNGSESKRDSSREMCVLIAAIC